MTCREMPARRAIPGPPRVVNPADMPVRPIMYDPPRIINGVDCTGWAQHHPDPPPRRYPRKNLSGPQKIMRQWAHYTRVGRELDGIKRARDRADIRARELARQRYLQGVFI